MTDNAEEGIARIQVAKNVGLGKHHESGVKYVDERTSIYLSALAVIGLMVIWATASSAYIVYGSFVAVIVMVLLFAVLRFTRTEQIRHLRKLQVKEMQSKPQE